MRRLVSVLLVLVLCIYYSMPVWAVSTLRRQDLTARRVIALCFDSGLDLFVYDADIPHAPASMTKMMVVYLAYEAMAQGLFTADCAVPISALAQRTSQDAAQTNVRLTQTRTYTVGQLLDIIIVASAGGATLALAEFIGGSVYGFLQKANDKIDEWGIHAFMQSAVGGTLPTFFTPRAMAELTRNSILFYPQILERTGATAVYFHGVRFPHPMAQRFPGMDGFKTGSHSVARFNYAGTAYQDGHRIITVVMGSATADSRFRDTARLMQYGFAVIREGRYE